MNEIERKIQPEKCAKEFPKQTAEIGKISAAKNIAIGRGPALQKITCKSKKITEKYAKIWFFSKIKFNSMQINKIAVQIVDKIKPDKKIKRRLKFSIKIKDKNEPKKLANKK